MEQMPDTCAVGAANQIVLDILKARAEEGNPITSYAEIGVYEGGTAVEVAKLLPDGAKMHLFDFSNRLKQAQEALLADPTLENHDITVRLVPNSSLLYDSYCWSLAKSLEEGIKFDMVFIDGAHTWHHDGFAFLLINRMLVEGGIVVFDDYGWSINTSPTMNPKAFPSIVDQYTSEQINARQIQMLVELLVKPDPSYTEIIPNVAYQKVTNGN